MIERIVPQKIQAYLRHQVELFVRQEVSRLGTQTFRNLIEEAHIITKMIVAQSKDHFGSYLPYRPAENCYMLSREDRDPVQRCDHGLPIPPEHLWLHYGPTKELYLRSGEIHVDEMMKVLNDAGHVLNPGVRILDFGCGAGRMIRWFKNIACTSEIWGCDIGAEHIVWCQQHLMPPFNFFTSTTVPHLPFDDKYFDFIYAGSVFTHIDDLATAWLCELRRILNPQGTAYITIHDKKTIELMNDKWFDHPFARLMRDNPNYVEYIKADFGMFAINRSVNSHIFYDVDYFCKLLQPLYEVVAIKEEAYAYQTEVSGKCRPVPRKLLESRGKDDKLRCL